MMLNVHADRHGVRPSMEIFSFQSVSRDERRWLNSELQAKVAELESFYASYKLGRARRRNQTEDFSDSVKFDGDLLLKMVDDLERNLKLSQSEVSKGRAYEYYAARRGAKLREEEVGWKGRQRREELEAMENRFEESWVELKTKGRDFSRVENNKGAIDDSLKNHNEDSSTSARSTPKSSSKNINLDSPTASPQSLPSFYFLSKENTRTATNSTPLQTSKSTGNLDELKQRMEHSKSSTALEIRGSIDNIVEEEALISHIELDGGEPRPSEESGTCDFSSEKTEISRHQQEADDETEILRHQQEADDELVYAFKLNSSLDGERESSNPEEQNAGEAADAARGRKKWVIAEKTTIATGNSSNKMFKNVVKQFKKLIKLGRKGKNTHNAVSVGLKLSSEHLKKSRNDYSVPDHVVGLYEGKIFPRQDIKSMEADQLERFPKCRSQARLNDKLRVQLHPAGRVL